MLGVEGFLWTTYMNIETQQVAYPHLWSTEDRDLLRIQQCTEHGRRQWNTKTLRAHMLWNSSQLEKINTHTHTHTR